MSRVFGLVLLFGWFLSAKIIVASSIAPVSSLIKDIAKDKVEVITVVEAGKSPHTYEPKVSLMKKLEKAELYFAIGVEFERVWIDKFKAQNPNLKVVYLDRNITKILLRVKGKIAREDPHIWLSPSNMEIIAKEISNSFKKIDKKDSLFFEKNYKETISKIEELKEKIKTILKRVPKGAKFMVFHPSWGYFAKEFGLIQLPIEIEGKEPKPAQLIKLIKVAKKDNIKSIVVEPEFSSKSAEVLAKELNAKIVKLSPLAPNWQETILKLAKTIAEGFES